MGWRVERERRKGIPEEGEQKGFKNGKRALPGALVPGNLAAASEGPLEWGCQDVAWSHFKGSCPVLGPLWRERRKGAPPHASNIVPRVHFWTSPITFFAKHLVDIVLL